jgi:transcription initiation factor TFIIIB Brf1 subunit/transcription initiation factor TFIIB
MQSAQIEVKKCPPLSCPSCKSTKVYKNSARKIVCDNCNIVHTRYGNPGYDQRLYAGSELACGAVLSKESAIPSYEKTKTGRLKRSAGNSK